MAFPVLASRVETNTTGTTHAISLPSGILANDLILIVAGQASAFSFPANPTSFTRLGSSKVHGSSTFNVYAKKAAGGETTVNQVQNQSCNGIYQGMRVTGWGADSVTNDIDSTEQIITATQTSHNPVSVTAGWGAKDNLFIATCSIGGPNHITGFPSGYGNTLSSRIPGGAGPQMAVASCTKNSALASDDPGNFSWSGNSASASLTLVIEPAPPAAQTISGAGNIASAETIPTTHEVNIDASVIERSAIIECFGALEIGLIEVITEESADFLATGDLSADPRLVFDRDADFLGSAELEATGESFREVEAGISCSGSLTADGDILGVFTRTADFLATAEAAANPVIFTILSADFSGRGDLTATRTIIRPRTADFSATGQATVSSVERFKAVDAQFEGTASFFADNYIRFTVVSAGFEASAELEAIGDVQGIISVGAMFTGTATVEVSATEQFNLLSASFLGTGLFSATVEDSLITIGASFQASGNLSTGPPTFARLWVEQVEQEDVWSEIA